MIEYIERIHPVNAEYLIHSELYRVYADPYGNMYELAIEKITGQVNALLAYYYHDGASMWAHNQANVALLSPEGGFFWVDTPQIRAELDINILYMFLNPLAHINGWQYQKKLSQNTIPEDVLRNTYPKASGPRGVYNLLFEIRSKYLPHI